MDTTVDGIAASVHNVALSESAPGDRGHEPLRSTRSNLTLLKHAIQRLGQATETITSQARSVE